MSGKRYHFALLLFLALLTSCGGNVPAVAETGIAIPRSSSGDKGRYYLLESTKSGNVITTLHKRVGVDSVGFSRLEIDCGTMRMREIGYGEGSLSNIKMNPTDWFDLVPGSSKSDVALFVCK